MSFFALLRSALLAITAITTIPLSAAAELRIMAFGDSLVHGYGLAAGETFPDQLEAALRTRGHDVRLINAGNSGDTTAAGLARIDWALADSPDALIVVLGANDGLRGIDPAHTKDNLDRLLTRLDEAGLPVLLAGMLAPRNLGAEYAEEFDAVFPALAERHGVLFHPFFLEGVAAEPALNQGDGIHPNAEGVEVIVESILPQVEELLELARREAGRADG